MPGGIAPCWGSTFTSELVLFEGDADGTVDGLVEGDAVGAALGELVGADVCVALGDAVGVGDADGLVGVEEALGDAVGDALGAAIGCHWAYSVLSPVICVGAPGANPRPEPSGRVFQPVKVYPDLAHAPVPGVDIHVPSVA